MKKIAFAFMVISTIFPCSFLKAQYGRGKIEDIEKVQSRKLIVVTEEPRESIIKKLTRKGKQDRIDSYKSALDEYNNNMKSIAEQYWPYKNGIEYKTYKEVEALRKSKEYDYAVLYCISERPSNFSYGFTESDGLNWTWNMKEESEDRDYFDYFTSMVITDVEKFGKSPIYETPLPDIFPTKASVVFGINSIKTYFDYRIRTKKNKEHVNEEQEMEAMMAENAPKLKDMTLLIRKDWLNSELTERSIKSYYKYKYKVCDKEEMDDSIDNAAAKTAYIVILPYIISTSSKNSIIYIHFIFSADDEQLMAYIRPSMGSMLGAAEIGGKAGKRTIEKKNIEKFMDIINGKK